MYKHKKAPVKGAFFMFIHVFRILVFFRIFAQCGDIGTQIQSV